MDVSATMTSRGRVTIPRPVREALGIAEGDRVLFRVTDRGVTLAKTQNLLDLAGAVAVPAARRGASWEEVRRTTRRRTRSTW